MFASNASGPIQRMNFVSKKKDSQKAMKDVGSSAKNQDDCLFSVMKNRKQKRWSKRHAQKAIRAIQTNPESLTITDDYHRTPLLLALLNNAPSNVLVAAIESNPDALLVKDRAVLGNTFLHEAMSRKGVDPSVLFAAIRACPKALGVVGSGGQTPISVAIQLDSVPLAVIVEAIRAFPEALSITGYNGMTPLHLIIKDSDSKPRAIVNKIILSIIEAHPQALAIQDSWGQTPLHIGMGKRWNDIDSCVLEAAMNARPDAISMKTFQEHDTVLHVGMKFAAPSGAIIAAIKASPETLVVSNKRNYNPLWEAMMQYSSLSEEVLMAVMNANPKALKRDPEDHGNIPEKFILLPTLLKSTPIPFLLSVIRNFPESVLERTSLFESPIIHEMIGRQIHLDVLKEAVKVQPSIVMMKNKKGQTPLCYAAELWPNYDLFKLLIRYGPAAVNEPDDDGLTPIYIMKRSSYEKSFMRAIEEATPLTIHMIPNMDCTKRRFFSVVVNVVAKRIEKAMVRRGLTNCGIPHDIWLNIFGMLCEDDLVGVSKLSYLRIICKSTVGI
mmetsp:Transcript_6594/g.9749  ORF Transcript_6594/g.9749 Transcript_6594/m.9749 type:complete len:554 (-) Transcript_6594:493-2154(-)